MSSVIQKTSSSLVYDDFNLIGTSVFPTTNNISPFLSNFSVPDSPITKFDPLLSGLLNNALAEKPSLIVVVII